MDILKFPIVFNSTGIATHPEGSRDFYSQLISNLSLVKFGDLPLRQDVGVPYEDFRIESDVTSLAVTIAQNIPEIRLTSVQQRNSRATDSLGTSALIIDFEVVNAVS